MSPPTRRVGPLLGMGHDTEITITLNKGSEPVLVTGSPTIIRAVLDALSEVLEGAPRRRVLELQREAKPRTGKDQGGEPEGGA